jgi:hypothetical protein
MPRRLGPDSRNLTRNILRAIRGGRWEKQGSGTWEAAVRLSRFRSTFRDWPAFDAAVTRLVRRGLICHDGVEPPALTLAGVILLDSIYPAWKSAKRLSSVTGAGVSAAKPALPSQPRR